MSTRGAGATRAVAALRAALKAARAGAPYRRLVEPWSGRHGATGLQSFVHYADGVGRAIHEDPQNTNDENRCQKKCFHVQEHASRQIRWNLDGDRRMMRLLMRVALPAGGNPLAGNPGDPKMKSVLATVILAFGLGAVVAMAGQGQADKALQDAAAARTKSMQSGDADGWGKYTTDDFVVIQADGTVKTKQERLAEIKGTPTPASDTTEQKWRTYGSTTAISTARATIDGKPTRITSVWVKQPDGWRVASVQLTNIAAAK